MLHRWTLLALSAALTMAVPALGAAADLKVAYVDYQRVLLEVADGKAAKARLQKWLDERQKEIDREQEGLRKEKELLEKQASAMSEETRLARGTELQKKVFELAQKWEKSRAEAADRERKEMEPIVTRIDQVIGQIAEREGLSLVFERRDSGIVFALTQLDLTNEVLRGYESLPRPKAAAPSKEAPKK